MKFDRIFHKNGQMRCRVTQCQYNEKQKRCDAQVVNFQSGSIEEEGAFEARKILDGTQCVPVVEEAGMLWGTLGWKDQTVCKNQMCPAGQGATLGALSNCDSKFQNRVRV